jgi:hypothetical protein
MRLLQPALPVRRDVAGRPRDRLLQRVVLRWSQCGAGEELVGPVVPEPVLTRFEATDHRVPRGPGVTGRVLARRVVAAADVATFCASSQVEPPSARVEALDAAGTAWGHARLYGFVSHGL